MVDILLFFISTDIWYFIMNTQRTVLNFNRQCPSETSYFLPCKIGGGKLEVPQDTSERLSRIWILKKSRSRSALGTLTLTVWVWVLSCMRLCANSELIFVLNLNKNKILAFSDNSECVKNWLVLGDSIIIQGRHLTFSFPQTFDILLWTHKEGC